MNNKISNKGFLLLVCCGILLTIGTALCEGEAQPPQKQQQEQQQYEDYSQEDIEGLGMLNSMNVLEGIVREGAETQNADGEPQKPMTVSFSLEPAPGQSSKISSKKKDSKLNPKAKVKSKTTYFPPQCSRKTKKGDVVKVHYSAFGVDNQLVDTTHSRGKPLEFVVGEGKVFKGIDQGVMAMCIGEKRTVTVPPELAMKEVGIQSHLNPYSIIQFDVHLVGIKGVKTLEAGREDTQTVKRNKEIEKTMKEQFTPKGMPNIPGINKPGVPVQANKNVKTEL